MTSFPYVSELIVALTTLSGVALTLVFTGRRENRRFVQQMEFERRKLVHEYLRAACIRFLNAFDTLEEVYYAVWNGVEEKRPVDESALLGQQNLEQVKASGSELKLVEPSLEASVDAALFWVDVMEDANSMTPDDLWNDHWERAHELRGDLQEQMRRVLAVAP